MNQKVARAYTSNGHRQTETRHKIDETDLRRFLKTTLTALNLLTANTPGRDRRPERMGLGFARFEPAP